MNEDVQTATDAPISDLSEIIRSLRPLLNDGIYSYLSVPDDFDLTGLDVVGTFREAEGLSVIISERDAQKTGYQVLFRAAWITLSVRSDLEAVGLTAAISSALRAAGISCNVVAAAFHDHIFVPVDMADKAMKVLTSLQEGHF